MLTLPVSCLVLKSVAENKSDESGVAGQKKPPKQLAQMYDCMNTVVVRDK